MNTAITSSSTESDVLDNIGEEGVSPKTIHSAMGAKGHSPDLVRRAIHHLQEQGKVSVDCSLKIRKSSK